WRGETRRRRRRKMDMMRCPRLGCANVNRDLAKSLHQITESTRTGIAVGGRCVVIAGGIGKGKLAARASGSHRDLLRPGTSLGSGNGPAQPRNKRTSGRHHVKCHHPPQDGPVKACAAARWAGCYIHDVEPGLML